MVKNDAENTVAYFPIFKGCTSYTKEFFERRLRDDDIKFHAQEFRVSFDAASVVEAVGVLTGQPRIDDIRLSRLISEVSRGCYPDTYTELDVRADAEALNLGIDLKYALGDKAQIAAIVLSSEKIRIYAKNQKSVEDALAEGEMPETPPVMR